MTTETFYKWHKEQIDKLEYEKKNQEKEVISNIKIETDKEYIEKINKIACEITGMYDNNRVPLDIMMKEYGYMPEGIRTYYEDCCLDDVPQEKEIELECEHCHKLVNFTIR